MATAPATHFSTSVIRAALIGAVCVAAVQVVTSQNTATFSRVRSSSARIVEAIAGGVERSATFRGLVDTIDGTDGLVFVEAGNCGHTGVRACLLLSVTVAGPNRLLRILVDLRKAPGCELVQAIGHELQHAVEVLHERHIRSDRQIHNFFDMLGRTTSVRFETDKAMEAGLAVSREACRGRRARFR
jgi:hypothetical protein